MDCKENLTPAKYPLSSYPRWEKLLHTDLSHIFHSPTEEYQRRAESIRQRKTKKIFSVILKIKMITQISFIFSTLIQKNIKGEQNRYVNGKQRTTSPSFLNCKESLTAAKSRKKSIYSQWKSCSTQISFIFSTLIQKNIKGEQNR
ncbi:hypothetical protein AVEN_164097-1 [Araneus ventricosus]|uniref:Uncharacterized protein n=1 Tax=Araneus ventricosus TaxID=182803 RepID=A0A4Y2KSM2_ARAVE|nr:hypothetical protein AVEN_164097-1 [Araneus ventricosus]